MKSILIIGLGRFGKHLAEKFIEEGNEVLVIEKDETQANNSIATIENIQIGDARNEDFIKSLGVNNFDICAIAIGDNFQTSLEITVLLKDFGAKFILARANRDVHKNLLLRNGADYVVYSERDMAEHLAVKYSTNNLFEYTELIPGYGIYEIAVPNSWYQKSILEKEIRVKYNIIILAIKNGEIIKPLPDPKHIFSKDETIIVMGDRHSIKNLTNKVF